MVNPHLWGCIWCTFTRAPTFPHLAQHERYLQMWCLHTVGHLVVSGCLAKLRRGVPHVEKWVVAFFIFSRMAKKTRVRVVLRESAPTKPSIQACDFLPPPLFGAHMPSYTMFWLPRH